MLRQTPILFLSDSVGESTGLARITRDICALLSSNPRFRVGSLGLGGQTSRTLPWAQYVIDERRGLWGSGDIRRVWEDFAGRQRGIVMTIWDATRTHWLARAEYCGDPTLMSWLQNGPFDLWGYVPVDATGPGDRLSGIAQSSLLGYGRLLAYTRWGSEVIERTIGRDEANRRGLDWLPHGLDLNIWKPQDRETARKLAFPHLLEGDKLIGVVATNQSRKDWGLAADVTRRLREKNSRLRAWWHTDLLERYWSIPALLNDFGLSGSVTVTTSLDNAGLAARYSACDVTMHIGAGEGFGYPIFESLACGTPSVYGGYGGGADLLEDVFMGGVDNWTVRPTAFRYDGLHNSLRPVFDPATWADKLRVFLEDGVDLLPDKLSESVAYLGWDKLWPSRWERWFNEGLEVAR